MVIIPIKEIGPPSSNGAQPDILAGGSSDPEQVDVYAFDASSQEYVDYELGFNGDYADGGITVRIACVAASGTSSNFRIEAAIRRLDTSEDLDSSHTYSYQGVSIALAASAHQMMYGNIALTDGTQIDSWDPTTEKAIMRISRNVGHGDDGASGDSLVLMPEVYETGT